MSLGNRKLLLETGESPQKVMGACFEKVNNFWVRKIMLSPLWFKVETNNENVKHSFGIFLNEEEEEEEEEDGVKRPCFNDENIIKGIYKHLEGIMYSIHK